jgi:hypothetical protein
VWGKADLLGSRFLASIRLKMITISNKWDGSAVNSDRGPTYIDLTISPDEGDLIIDVNAPYYGDPKPAQGPGRCPKLWEHEVVELFIVSTQAQGDPNNAPYLEFIVGPHGHWLILGFPGEGRWEDCEDDVMLDSEPAVRIDPVTNRWSATISFPCHLLPEPECDPNLPLSLKWICNAFAMHGAEPNRTYMSCYPVPGDAPNFHQLKYFQPLTLFESDPNRHPSADIRAGPYETIGPSQLIASLAASHLRSTSQDEPNYVEEKYDIVPSAAKAGKAGITVSTSPIAANASRDTNVLRGTVTTKRRSILEVAESNRIAIPPSPPTDGAAVSSSSPPPAASSNDASAASGVDVVDGVSLFDEKYLRHLHEGEFVVLIGRVWKRKVSDDFVLAYMVVSNALLTGLQGWSYKKRILILSSKPRLLYINSDGLYKGSISWTMTTPISVKKVRESYCIAHSAFIE